MAKEIEILFETYYQDIYRYLYSLCHDAFLSEDLAGEVFLEVMKSIGAFRGESDVKTWLFSIARHRWLQYLKKQSRNPQTELLSDFLEDTGEDMETAVLDRVKAEQIKRLIEQEPERTRNIFYMRMEGYSFYEIGKQYHISENSARVIDFRLKAKIRHQLKKEENRNE